MKSTLLRLGALLLTFTVSVAILQFSRNYPAIESLAAVDLSRVESFAATRCPTGDELLRKDMPPMFMVPNDSDFYFGKRKVSLSEIHEIAQKLSRPPFQVVYIKSSAGVRFETVMLIANELKSADIRCIEFVLDKKKKSVVQ